jgi:hypothetical protein
LQQFVALKQLISITYWDWNGSCEKYPLTAMNWLNSLPG